MYFPAQVKIPSFALSMSSSSSSSTSSSAATGPGRTFIECTRQAAVAAKKAIEDGYKLIEVEFPPLPLEYLEDSSSSARSIADANTRWALEFSQTFSPQGKVSVIYPDKPELDDAIKYVNMEGNETPYPNITLATIRTDSISNAKSLDQIFASIFGATVGGTVEGIANTHLYVALVSSTQELPDLEKLHNLDPSIPIVFFNLRLDVLKGDLGLPLFPGRELHYRFLSKIKTAYIIKNRSFSTSLTKPPFIINYSGILFRAYPEPYQSILNIGGGKTKVVSYSKQRPPTAKFRDDLTGALRIPGLTAKDLKTTGVELWWEKDDGKESSDNWRF